jgi:hypothetical protein
VPDSGYHRVPVGDASDGSITNVFGLITTPRRTSLDDAASIWDVGMTEKGHEVRRLTVLFCLVVVLVLSAGASPVNAARDQHLAALPDASVTPPGWSPVSLGTIQISVPSDWFIEDPGYTCGGTAEGMVFINQSPMPPPNGAGCPLTANVIELSTATSASLPNSYRSVINSIPVHERDTQSQSDSSAVTVLALGTEVDARGSLAAQVIRTLTHSPLSVVLHSSLPSTPKGWRHVAFGGIRFVVPGQWTVQRDDIWGGCPGNITAGMLTLSTARKFFSPSCPAPPLTAGYLSASQGTVLGSGPLVGTTPRDASCLTRNSLRICIDPPPSPVGGFVPGHQLNLLTAQIHVPGKVSTDQIEIGLVGTGLTALRIFDSMRPAA